MSRDLPTVTVLLLERDRPSTQREQEAWQEAVRSYPGEAAVSTVEDGRLAATVEAMGLPTDTVAVVSDALVTPGPHLIERLVERLLEEAGAALVDARVLPVELTRVDDRERGFYLEDGADPTSDVLKETRHVDLDAPEDDDDDDGGEGEGEGEREPRERPVAVERPSTESSASSHNEFEMHDGVAVRLRLTGACTALRAGDLSALADILSLAPDGETGNALATSAHEHGLTAVVDPTAAVALPVRLAWDASVDELLPEIEQRSHPWAEHTHPARLPASSIGVVSELLGLELAGDSGTRKQSAPFLSIITRTQGKRQHCLEDMFTCLAAQTERDFEVLLMAHRVEAPDLDAVRRTVDALPGWLRERVRVIAVERPGRAAPLNDGFEAARGRYIAALDDDDTVLAHYVETFKSRAMTNDGQLLRVVCLRQDVAPVGHLDTLCAISINDPFREWPMDFALVAHLTANYSPFMSVAFPRGAFHDMGLRFDETLDTTEDWDFIVRCASVLGVSSIREVTCVYRWWVHTGSSREVHSKDEWDEARLRVQDRFERSILLLQPWETGRFVESLESTRRAAETSHRLARKMATTNHHTNLKMIETSKAHNAAQRKRASAERKVEKLRGELKQTRKRLREQRKRNEELAAALGDRANDSWWGRLTRR